MPISRRTAITKLGSGKLRNTILVQNNLKVTDDDVIMPRSRGVSKTP